MDNLRPKRIVIAGAGPGGLTAGMILAHRGYNVVILEKEERVGGRNAQLATGPYFHDTGPTFLHQKFTLDEVFAETGRVPEDYLKFTKLDPMTRLTWGKTCLDTSSDRATMAANIARSFPGDEVGYHRFMNDHAEKLRSIFPCLQQPYHRLSNYFSSQVLKVLPYIATKKSVVDVLDGYFKDDRLKLAFTFQAKYLGMSPWSCPALFSILSFIEYQFGIYHVEGGLCKISEAMAKVFEEEGGTLHLGRKIEEIEWADCRAKAVVVEDGERFECDDLIINADYAQAMTTFMKQKGKPYARMDKKKFSCSTFMLYLGLDKIYESEPHHHIIFADNYRQNVEEIGSEKIVSEDMSVYVRNASVSDPTLAPAGHSSVYVLVPSVNCRADYDWDREGEGYRDLVLDKIESQTGFTDIRQHIQQERILSPADWERMGIFRGATFNLAHTMDQMLYLRPHNIMQGFENVFLVGGGTHPGSGLPTIYESGRISSNLLCERYGEHHSPVDFATDILAGACSEVKGHREISKVASMI